MALFGGTVDERREPRSLVEFRAGKMSLSQGVVTADKRKGLVYMKTSGDSLLHFCWKDRQNGEVVDVRPYYQLPSTLSLSFSLFSQFTNSQKPSFSSLLCCSLFSSLCFLSSPSFPPSSLHLLPTPLPPSLHLSCVRTSSSSPGRRNFSPSPSAPLAESFS